MNETLEHNQIYNHIKETLDTFETELIEIEKNYYHSAKRQDDIITKLNELHTLLEEKGVSTVSHKIKTLRDLVIYFRNKRGYNHDSFHKIYEYYHLTQNNIEKDLSESELLSTVRQNLSYKFHKIMEEKIKKEFFGKVYQRYLFVKSNDLHFMIPVKKVLWEKVVPNKSKLKIQIKSMPLPNTFQFTHLPQYTIQNETLNKTAILFETNNGLKVGVLVDVVEKQAMFAATLVKRKTLYLHIGEDRYEPYLELQGNRYFLRETFNET